MSDLKVYTVAWICAIGTELVAAKQFLDETHDDADLELPDSDDNTYIMGKVGRHSIVIVALPHRQYGLVSAAIVARDMVHSFPNLRFALMVGIGGGAPSQRHDIRLGDIVVSSPESGTGGVLQYDFGKTIQDESFDETGHLNQSPQCLLRAIPFLEADYESDGNGIDTKIVHILEKKPLLRAKYGKPDSSTDRLFKSAYKHAGEKDQECTAVCVDASQIVVRPERPERNDGPMIHFGLIASANQVMKDAKMRDRISSERDVLCFEMEAAGLMNHCPCLVIRGICDYSDTHKNKIWQGYAALAAAAYAKDLLGKIAPNKIQKEQRLLDILQDVGSQLEDINSRVRTTHADIESIRMDKHSKDIMQWLAPPDVSSNLNKAIKARHAGSGQSLLESELYTTWKRQDKSFLWLHGIPGSGKTILVSTVIEDLERSHGQNHSQTLLYSYFDFTDIRKQDFENTLRSLIYQTYHQNQNARKHLDSVYSSAYQDGRSQPSFVSLEKVFNEMLCKLEEVWIVLDALDECTARRELLSWIETVTQGSLVQANVHLLVTSRPEQDIKCAIQRHASEEQMISINDMLEADIRNYIYARIREHKGLSRWHGHTEIQEEIEATLVKKADGMFRWVACQLDALENCLERRALIKALNSLPESLDETYERILAGIPSQHVHHTRRILQFLIFSERPLRLNEAVDAIAVDTGRDVARGSRFDPKDRLPIPQEITRYCSSLVTLVARRDNTVQEIQLSHFSVKEYLTSNRVGYETALFLQEKAARTSIAEVCLAYLLELELSSTFNKIEDDFYFAQYAMRYWLSHAIIGERHSKYVCKLTMELLCSRKVFACWFQLHNSHSHWLCELIADDIDYAVYYASLLGLPCCVRTLISHGANVNAQGGYYGNVLQAASYQGHQEVAQVLLDNKADVNAQGGYFGNALRAALYGRHQELVQILLANGADINAQVGYCGNALQIASFEGHQDIVQILINNKANVNAQGGEYGNALYAASYEGHCDIVQILLANGANVHAKNKDCGSALHAALHWGHQKVVHVLLDNGADSDA